MQSLFYKVDDKTHESINRNHLISGKGSVIYLKQHFLTLDIRLQHPSLNRPSNFTITVIEHLYAFILSHSEIIWRLKIVS